MNEDILTNQLEVVYKPTDSLRAYTNNARTHSKPQIRQIAASMKEFGFTNPILIDSKNTIIAGHGRVVAAKNLGIAEVPTIRLEGLSPDQIRAYILADNKIAENAGWDKDVLAIELQYLIGVQGSLDVTVTGFEIGEIDLIIGNSLDKEEDEDLGTIEDRTVNQLGDLWLLGEHRILCGSALDGDAHNTLMAGKKANLCFTDPPYNVVIDGHATGNGAIRHREFAMASGEMTKEQFSAFLKSSLGLLAQSSTPGSVHFICMDWRHTGELLTAGEEVYDQLLNLCVWVKDNGGMGSLYRSQHEMIFVFRNKGAKHLNNVQLGKYGRNRTNVWSYPGVNTMSRQGDEGNLLSIHPTVKPIAMVADAILDCSAPKDIVLDTFLGSGTTLLAATRVGRICYGLELDFRYVDLAVRRWQRYTGEQAVHHKTKQIFDEVVAERSVSDAVSHTPDAEISQTYAQCLSLCKNN